MSKQTGLNSGLLVGASDISGDVGALTTIGSPRSVHLVTGIDKSAPERNLGLSDGIIEFAPWYNAVGAHVDLAALPSTDIQVSAFLPKTQGSVVASLLAKQINYDWTRDQAGNLTGAVQALASAGVALEMGVQLTAFLDTFTTAAATSSVDNRAATTGGAVIVHCTAFTGTDLVIDLQESTDDGAGDAFADVDVSVQVTVTAPGVQRLEIGEAIGVERYVRANITGTFTTADVAIIYVSGPAV